MLRLNRYILLVLGALLLFSSCQHDEPVDPVKPLDERTVLVLSSDGNIYNQDGELVKQLPNCTYAAEIIADGNDYFVSGIQSKDRVGYWKNGKWNTLHIDFIDDVDHMTYGIGKWDYYIYLLDLPNVLKNSGIFPLENYHDFIPAFHGLRVTEGKCYVIGYAFDENDEQSYYKPVLYTNYKKEFLPMPEDAMTGECHALYAYDRDHTLVGGTIGRYPAIWIDKEYQIYETTQSLDLPGDDPYARIESITLCNGHIYASGWELNENHRTVATLWTDGVPVQYKSEILDVISSQATNVYSYGGDVYMLTVEYAGENYDKYIHLWLNGTIIMTYRDFEPSGFTVL